MFYGKVSRNIRTTLPHN